MSGEFNSTLGKIIDVALDLRAENIWLREQLKRAPIYVAAWYDPDSMEKTERNLTEFLARERIENESVNRV